MDARFVFYTFCYFFFYGLLAILIGCVLCAYARQNAKHQIGFYLLILLVAILIAILFFFGARAIIYFTAFFFGLFCAFLLAMAGHQSDIEALREKVKQAIPENKALVH